MDEAGRDPTRRAGGPGPVPYSRPNIEAADVEAVVGALESGWLAFGEEKAAFEAEFAACVGMPHAVSLNSCTSALELSLKAAGVRGEVVVPSFTWVATASAVVNGGAVPVFCDVAEATRNMRAEDIAAALSPATEAVIVVHYAGQACDMAPIEALCASHGLLLIEDCAQTLGGTDPQGRLAGSFGIGCFSFYPTKAITCGEGGMLTTADAALAERVRSLSSHGLGSAPPLHGGVHEPWARAASVAGHNLRMPNILAALGRSQLRRLDSLNARRAGLAAAYMDALRDLVPLTLPYVEIGARHVWQMFTVQLPATIRGAVLHSLWDDGIGANIHFDPPVHRQPAHSQRPLRVPLPVSEKLAGEILSLPIFPDLRSEDQQRVVESLKKAVRQCR